MLSDDNAIRRLREAAQALVDMVDEVGHTSICGKRWDGLWEELRESLAVATAERMRERDTALVDWIRGENAKVRASLAKRYRLDREDEAQQEGKLKAGEAILGHIIEEFGMEEIDDPID